MALMIPVCLYVVSASRKVTDTAIEAVSSVNSVLVSMNKTLQNKVMAKDIATYSALNDIESKDPRARPVVMTDEHEAALFSGGD